MLISGVVFTCLAQASAQAKNNKLDSSDSRSRRALSCVSLSLSLAERVRPDTSRPLPVRLPSSSKFPFAFRAENFRVPAEKTVEKTDRIEKRTIARVSTNGRARERSEAFEAHTMKADRR